MLLLFVGQYDPNLIEQFKRTNIYTQEDYRLLKRVLKAFKRVVTTPNIITEVSNLSNAFRSEIRDRYYEKFRMYVEPLDEEFVPSMEAASNATFVRHGITDSAIAMLARQPLLVLTDDFRLASALGGSKIDVINFNRLRSFDL